MDFDDPNAGAGDLIYAGEGTTSCWASRAADTIYGEDGDDDLIGGHNVAGGLDTDDAIDGGGGNDVIAGDNAYVYRQLSLLDPRHRSLTGTQIYGTTAASTIGGVFDRRQ